MKLLKIIGLLLMAFLIGCAPGGGGSDDDDEDQTLVNPYGWAHAGMCKLASIVAGADVDLSYFIDAYVEGEVIQNDGEFSIPNEFSGPYLMEKFEGTCYSEGDGVYVDNIKMRSLCPISAQPCNINHATTWAVSLGYRYYGDDTHPNYQDIPGSYLAARDDIYNFLNFPNASANFYSLSIVGDTTADAYLLAFETAVTRGRNGPEQGDYIGRAVNAVINNDLSFRNELRNTISSLPIKSIVDNMNSELSTLGFSETAAPVWKLPFFPSYYDDWITGSHSVVEEINPDVTSTIGFDTAGYNEYYFPYVFSSIFGSKYLGLKYQTGDVSFYSVTTCNQGSGDFPCPGVEVAVSTEMRENLMGYGQYNGSLGSHGMTNGTQYFLRLKQESEFRPTFATSSGDLWEFGNPLATNNGGATYLIITGAVYQRQQPLRLTD